MLSLSVLKKQNCGSKQLVHNGVNSPFRVPNHNLSKLRTESVNYLKLRFQHSLRLERQAET